MAKHFDGALTLALTPTYVNDTLCWVMKSIKIGELVIRLCSEVHKGHLTREARAITMKL